MTYDLYLGDRSYSSWSLRAWLIARQSGLDFNYRYLDFSTKDVAGQLSDVGDARTVPTLVTPEGAVISESIAIAEELATRAPKAGLWPSDPKARAIARTLTAEMHSGFMALREACPMNLRVAYADVPVSDAVKADVARIEQIWTAAQDATGAETWLCGDYTIADAFYAPVAMRIATYNLPVGPRARAYVEAHLHHGPFRRWRAMGLVRGETLPWYARDYAPRPWPGPVPLPAADSDGAGAVNTRCPYSGDPVTDFLTFEGRVYGFCNPFCRDKTRADPEAWPAFMALARG